MDNNSSIETKTILDLEHNLFKDFGTLISGHIHDINNPIAVITGQISILETLIQMKKLDEDRVIKACTKVNNSTEKLLHLITHMRNFYKPFESNNQETPLIETLDSLLNLNKTKLYRDEVELNFELIESNSNVLLTPKETTVLLWNLLQFSIDLAKLNNCSIQLEVKESKAEFIVAFSFSIEILSNELVHNQVSLRCLDSILNKIQSEILVENPTTLSIKLQKIV